MAMAVETEKKLFNCIYCGALESDLSAINDEFKCAICSATFFDKDYQAFIKEYLNNTNYKQLMNDALKENDPYKMEMFAKQILYKIPDDFIANFYETLSKKIIKGFTLDCPEEKQSLKDLVETLNKIDSSMHSQYEYIIKRWLEDHKDFFDVKTLKDTLVRLILTFIGIGIVTYHLIATFFPELEIYLGIISAIVSGLISGAFTIVRKKRIKLFELLAALIFLGAIITLIGFIDSYANDSNEFAFRYMIVTNITPWEELLGQTPIFADIQITHSNFGWGRQKIRYTLHRRENDGQIGDFLKGGYTYRFFTYWLVRNRTIQFRGLLPFEFERNRGYILRIYVNGIPLSVIEFPQECRRFYQIGKQALLQRCANSYNRSPLAERYNLFLLPKLHRVSYRITVNLSSRLRNYYRKFCKHIRLKLVYLVLEAC